jgi:hypothetical protein
MSLSLSVNTPNLDSNGSPIAATYWHIIHLEASPLVHTFRVTYCGYASAASFAMNPTQPPLLTQDVSFPDNVNAAGVAWPFDPATLASEYPGNPMAMLAAMEAYALAYCPFFAGASQVS